MYLEDQKISENEVNRGFIEPLSQGGDEIYEEEEAIMIHQEEQSENEGSSGAAANFNFASLLQE